MMYLHLLLGRKYIKILCLVHNVFMRKNSEIKNKYILNKIKLLK